METRQITILDSETQSRHVINTSATTFGELKRLVQQAGVKTEGKDWLEGFTKTSPRDDASILPTNVPYKGRTTNNLVYMLTNTNKKTNSGLDRKALYKRIKELDLAGKIKEAFNENYTRLKSDVLADFINGHEGKAASKLKDTPEVREVVIPDTKIALDTVAKAIAEYSIKLGVGDTVAKYIEELTPKNVELSQEELDNLFN